MSWLSVHFLLSDTAQGLEHSSQGCPAGILDNWADCPLILLRILHSCIITNGSKHTHTHTSQNRRHYFYSPLLTDDRWIFGCFWATPLLVPLQFTSATFYLTAEKYVPAKCRLLPNRDHLSFIPVSTGTYNLGRQSKGCKSKRLKLSSLWMSPLSILSVSRNVWCLKIKHMSGEKHLISP